MKMMRISSRWISLVLGNQLAALLSQSIGSMPSNITPS